MAVKTLGRAGSVKINLLSVEGWEDVLALQGQDGSLTSEKAYAEQGWFRRAIDLRCAALDDTPFTIERIDDGAVVWDQSETDTLDGGGEVAWLSDLPAVLSMAAAVLPLESNAYILKRGTEGAQTGRRRIEALQWLMPGTITEQYDARTGQISGYQRTIGGKTVARFEPGDVLHLKSESPYNEQTGAHGAGRAALASAGVLYNMDGHLAREFVRGLISKFVYLTDEAVDPGLWEKFKAKWRRDVAGPKNAGEPMNLLKGELKRISQRLAEVAPAEITDKAVRAIAGAFGIPYTLFTSESASFATAQSDLYVFYALTIRPLGKRLQAQVNRDLLAPLGLSMTYQWQRLEVFQRAEVDKAQAMLGYVTSLLALEARGVLSLAEVRAVAESVLDLPELSEADDAGDTGDMGDAGGDGQMGGQGAEAAAGHFTGHTVTTSLPLGTDDALSRDLYWQRKADAAGPVAAFNPLAPTKAAREEHWKAVQGLRDADERREASRIDEALTEILRTAARRHAREEAEVEALDMEPLREAFEDLYLTTALAFAERTYDGVAKHAGKAYLPSVPSAREYMTYKAGADDVTAWQGLIRSILRDRGAARITRIKETLIAQVIRPWLDEAAQERWGPRRAAQILRQRMADITKARAERIARTELVSASNVGQMIGAERAAGALGLVMQKEWIATFDQRTRPDHASADGQRVPLDQPFSVGGTMLDQPGDMAGPADQVINCRCTVAFIVEE